MQTSIRHIFVSILFLVSISVACPVKQGMLGNGTIRIPLGLSPLCSVEAIKLGKSIAAQTSGAGKVGWSEVYSIQNLDSDVLENSFAKASYIITDSKQLANSGVIVVFSHINANLSSNFDRHIYVMILPKNVSGPLLMVFGNN